jgi:hypothetical protein
MQLRRAVPLDERAPELCAPLYQMMVERLLTHATYPPGFSSWDQANGSLDEDIFDRLRSVLWCIPGDKGSL